jgi:hypothetical protein
VLSNRSRPLASTVDTDGPFCPAEALIGIALDGYGIYGPEEDRAIASDLDACSGHVSETASSAPSTTTT